MENVHLSHNIQGAIIFSAGLILLLHTAGIIGANVNLLIVMGSLAMIFYGFMKMDISRKVLHMFKR